MSSERQAIRVVIADDHQMVREGLRMLLADEATAMTGPTALPPIVVVGEATKGDEAVREAERLRPDVVLMDLQMPGLDGIAATQAIRASTTQPAPRVLILTTFDDEAHVRDAIQAGATGYLLKDVLRDELVRAIRAAARGMPTLDARAQQMLIRQVTTPTVASPLDGLTPRERDVLRLIARGASNKAIAAELFLSVGTVKGYVSAILPKLGVTDRTQAALFAVKYGLE